MKKLLVCLLGCNGTLYRFSFRSSSDVDPTIAHLFTDTTKYDLLKVTQSLQKPR